MAHPFRYPQRVFLLLSLCCPALVLCQELLLREDSPTLRFESGVRSLFEDSRDRIWVGTHNEGVALIEGSNITYFDEESGLSDLQIRSIKEDEHGNIWFEGARGLSRYDGWRMTIPADRNYDSPHSWSVGDGDLWFKGDAPSGHTLDERFPGAYQFDGRNLSYRAFPVVPEAGESSYFSVTTPVVRGKREVLWFGTYGAAIGYGPDGFDVIDNSRLGLTETTGFLHIRSVFEDSQGVLWIGNNGIGLLKYDGLSVTHFSSQTQGLAEGLDRVFSIGEDRWGNLWFGTRDQGAYRYDGASLTHFAEAQGLESRQIWTIHRSKSGELWLGGANPSGVFRHDGARFERLF